MSDRTNSKEPQWHVLAVLLGLLLISVALILASVLLEPRHRVLSTVLRDIGFVFAPVAVLALLYQYFAERRHSQFVADHVSGVVLRDLRRRISSVSSVSGVTDVYMSRSDVPLNRLFQEAEHKIDVLTTNLETLSIHLGTFIERAKAGVHVRVLTLNPWHEFVETRARELYRSGSKYGPEDFRREMIGSLLEFCLAREDKLTPDEQKRFEIRLYKNPPSLMIFRFDDRAVLSLILRPCRARETAHIQLDIPEDPGSRGLGRDLMSHLDATWSEAQIVATSDIASLNPGAKPSATLPQ